MHRIEINPQCNKPQGKWLSRHPPIIIFQLAPHTLLTYLLPIPHPSMTHNWRMHAPVTHIPSKTHWYVCDFNTWTQHLLPVHSTQMKLSKRKYQLQREADKDRQAFMLPVLLACKNALCRPLLVRRFDYNASTKDFSTCIPRQRRKMIGSAVHHLSLSVSKQWLCVCVCYLNPQ